MNVIETKNLCKHYGKRSAVSGVNMHVRQGDIYGFIGRNGSGKSTTLKLLCGLARPTEGSIEIFGQSPEDPAARRRMGALIETAGLEPDKSAHENMLLKAMLQGLADPEPEIRRLLTLVGLNPSDRKKTKKFSMGMKQRLGIAMALLGGPDLLLLDEPINGLDPEGMSQIRTLLTDLNQKRGVTILVSSHILGELSKMATRYGILKDGRLIKEITEEELSGECRDYLYVKVDDPRQAAVALEECLGLRDYEVRPGGEIRVYEKGLEPAAVTGALISRRVAVQAIYPHSQDLEGYFLDLMGREDASPEKGGKHHA